MSQSEIDSNRNTELIQVVKKFCYIFKNLDKIANSFALVITKSEESDPNSYREDFNILLKEQLVNKHFTNDEITFYSLASTNLKIGTFKAPKEEGNIENFQMK